MNLKEALPKIWVRYFPLRLAKFLINKLKMIDSPWADYKKLQKAERFIERFREIISDPLNTLIERTVEAGYVYEGSVFLHNGNKVKVSGPLAYYGDFSDILVINRGVHEPLEEFCFQETLKIISGSPVTLELGSYWAHYSMWILKRIPEAKCYMVEPDPHYIKCGIHNFEINGFKGEFIQDFVSKNKFTVDKFLKNKNFNNLEILHSDIQGYELEMLEGAQISLKEKKINYIFISTHKEEIHSSILKTLKDFDYDIEVSSNFDDHTTSSDGFILASSSEVEKVFSNSFFPLGRKEIAASSSREIFEYLKTLS